MVSLEHLRFDICYSLSHYMVRLNLAMFWSWNEWEGVHDLHKHNTIFYDGNIRGLCLCPLYLIRDCNNCKIVPAVKPCPPLRDGAISSHHLAGQHDSASLIN